MAARVCFRGGGALGRWGVCGGALGELAKFVEMESGSTFGPLAMIELGEEEVEEEEDMLSGADAIAAG